MGSQVHYTKFLQRVEGTSFCELTWLKYTMSNQHGPRRAVNGAQSKKRHARAELNKNVKRAPPSSRHIYAGGIIDHAAPTISSASPSLPAAAAVAPAVLAAAPTTPDTPADASAPITASPGLEVRAAPVMLAAAPTTPDTPADASALTTASPGQPATPPHQPASQPVNKRRAAAFADGAFADGDRQRMEVAGCDDSCVFPCHECDWEHCTILSDHGATFDLEIVSDGQVCKGVLAQFVRPCVAPLSVSPAEQPAATPMSAEVPGVGPDNSSPSSGHMPWTNMATGGGTHAHCAARSY